MDNDTTVVIPVNREVLARASRLIPHGCRTIVYRTVLDLILDMLDRPKGKQLIGLLMEPGAVKLVPNDNAAVKVSTPTDTQQN